MPRLFVAVALPPDVLEIIEGLDRPPVEGLRWTDREQWHVTLRFLGAVDDAGHQAFAERVARRHQGTRQGDPSHDAVGVRITELPITAEKVYRALREREAHS